MICLEPSGMKRKMKQLTLYCLNEPSLSPMRGEGWSMGVGLHSFQQFREFCQCNDINIRKGRLAEYIKMMVVGYLLTTCVHCLSIEHKKKLNV